MKILQLSGERGGWSGGQEQFFSLAKGLVERGHLLKVACPSGSMLEKRFISAGFDVLSLPMLNDLDLYSVVRLVFFCRENSFDIIHALHPRAHALAVLAAHLIKTSPLVVTRRVSFPLKNNFVTRFKYLNDRIKRIICVSEAVKRELVIFKVPLEKVEVVYSGVDLKKFYPREKNFSLLKTFGIPENIPLIGCVANLSVWKGQRVFLEAAKILRDKRIDAHFLLAGGGNDLEPVPSWVQELGLKGIVSLMGFIDDVPSVMSAIDIFVSPSVGAEGLSGTTREALAMGLPVVATDVGGNREVVRNMETGVLVPPKSPESIAEAVEFLLKNTEKARKMAEAGRKFVVENCSLERMVEKTERIYMGLI